MIGVVGLFLALAPGSDACQAMLSPPVLAVIQSGAPGHRWPSVADADPADIAYSREHGGPACLCATRGDFDGSGVQDLAVILHPNQGSAGPLLAVLLHTDEGWRFSILRTFDSSAAGRLYVTTAGPGTFKHFEGHNPEPEEGEVMEIVSHHDVVVAGYSESSEVVYGWARGRWVHVWVSN